MRLIVYMFVLSAGAPLHAAITLSDYYADGMVIQRDAALVMRGSAAPGQLISVTVADQTHEARVDDNGRFVVTMDPMAATKPGDTLTLKLTGDGAATIRNVAVGELWLVAGGEHMRKQVRFAQDEQALRQSIRGADVRLFSIGGVAGQPRDEVRGKWQRCDSNGLRLQPILPYVAARKLQGELNVPVGLIMATAAYPDSPIEAWMSKSALEQTPAAKPILDFYAAGGWNRKALESHEKQLEKWKRQAQDLPLNPPGKPKAPMLFDDSKLRPSAAYNAMIAPLKGLPMRGVIWDHGDDEISVMHGVQYGKLLPALIEDWRRTIGLNDLPFIIVQLPAQRFGKFDDRCGAEVREAQSGTAQKVNHVAQVVTVDLGRGVRHSAIAERVAQTALGLAHGRSDMAWQTPVVDQVRQDGDRIVITFKHTGGGIEARGGDVRGVAIAASRYRWCWADVKIDGDTMTVSAPTVNQPQGVRYAYQDLPVHGVNLYSKNGRPVAPLRTDDHVTYTGQNKKPDDVDRYYTRKGIYIENPRLPRVLIIGDSISGGYHEPLRELLKDEANVVGESQGNGKSWQSMGPRCYKSTSALHDDQLKNWLASRYPFDIVTFNMGIHEFAGVPLSDDGAAYARRLAKVVQVIRDAGARPMWVNSTGTIRDGLIPRFPHYLSNCRRYNAAAETVMNELNVPIVDLYALTQPNIEKMISGDHIHFQEHAKQAMAELIANAVRTELKRLKPSSK